jgi:hypothetical protein
MSGFLLNSYNFEQPPTALVYVGVDNGLKQSGFPLTTSSFTWSSNDVFVMLFGLETGSVTPPTNWVLDGQQQEGYCYTWQAPSAGSGTFTFTGSGSGRLVGQCVQLRGINTSMYSGRTINVVAAPVNPAAVSITQAGGVFYGLAGQNQFDNVATSGNITTIASNTNGAGGGVKSSCGRGSASSATTFTPSNPNWTSGDACMGITIKFGV